MGKRKLIAELQIDNDDDENEDSNSDPCGADAQHSQGDQVDTKAFEENIEQEATRALADAVLGDCVSQTLDELSQELAKLMEERRIAAIVATAERDRRRREAEEAGRRQAEESLREREDEFFRKVMGWHRQSVDAYLHGILHTAISDAAHTQAEERETGQVQNNLTATSEPTQGDGSTETNLFSRLVDDLLIPHAVDEVQRRNDTNDAKRFSKAAEEALIKCVEQTAKKVEEEEKTTRD
eukprot:GHVT01001500.1.p1 GENE.GHVT01001500.1~~GHVT01001500.1.p1  ORF type:complete len:239 (-),score=40.91 GHVT01001500.1:1276-1992(-)